MKDLVSPMVLRVSKARDDTINNMHIAYSEYVDAGMRNEDEIAADWFGQLIQLVVLARSLSTIISVPLVGDDEDIAALVDSTLLTWEKR